MLATRKRTRDHNTLPEQYPPHLAYPLGVPATWTADTVKELLPDVMLEWYGTVYPGRVRGRQCKYARVYAELSPGRFTPDIEYTWNTVAHALNHKISLKGD